MVDHRLTLLDAPGHGAPAYWAVPSCRPRRTSDFQGYCWRRCSRAPRGSAPTKSDGFGIEVVADGVTDCLADHDGPGTL